MKDAYLVHGTHEKTSKTADGLNEIESWGKAVDGVSGLTSSPPPKLLQDCHVTLRCLLCRRTSRKLLEKLTGIWAPHLMDRRPAFAAFDCVYRAIQGMEYGKRYRWAKAVAEEFIAVVLWAPMLFGNMRAVVQPKLYITDA